MACSYMFSKLKNQYFWSYKLSLILQNYRLIIQDGCYKNYNSYSHFQVLQDGVPGVNMYVETHIYTNIVSVVTCDVVALVYCLLQEAYCSGLWQHQ